MVNAYTKEVGKGILRTTGKFIATHITGLVKARRIKGNKFIITCKKIFFY
jgi:hypothetical protein